MADAAHVDTDKKIKKLEKNIQEVYTEAQADIEDKINDFVKKYYAKESIYAQQVKEGKITQEQFDNWKKGQVFQGKQWQAKRDQIISTIHNSNTIATKIINGAAFGVFKNNANYTAYDLEHSNGVNFGFGIYDTPTVSKLLKDNPDLLPKWKVDEPKDYVWNKKKVNNAITQGIIQGERLDQITKRLSTGLASANENTMKTFARTAVTGAQNAGRENRLMSAKTKGINVQKEWMATLDGRTRHTHRMMDGEKLPVAKDIWHPAKFSNGCRYPGDPEGPAAEVYNCRCTMVGDVVDFPDEYKRYDNIDGKPIKNMTYQEWYKAKYGKELKAKKIAEKSAAKLTGIDYSKYPGGKEVFDVIKKYNGDWDEFIEESTAGDFDVVWNQTKNHIDEAQAWFDMAKDDIKKAEKLEKQTKVGKAVSKAKTKELTEIEKLQAQIDAAKADLKAFEDTLDKDILNKKWSGIWQNDVTLFDYEEKKDKILEKRLYYLKANVDLEKEFSEKMLEINAVDGSGLFKKFAEYKSVDDLKKDKTMVNRLLELKMKDGGPVIYDEDDLDDIWNMLTDSFEFKKVTKNLKFLEELEEFEDLGRKYSSVLTELKEKKLKVKTAESALKLATKGDPFDKTAYTQDRKNNALWPKSPRDADDALRLEAGKVWNNATHAEKDAIYEYTGSYHKFNEPLRGIEYGSNAFLGIGNTDLDASYAHNGARLNALTDLLDKSELPQDEWFQRGCNWSGMDKFFQCDLDFLQNATQEEFEKELLGKSVTEYAFMSVGSSKGMGFSNKPIIMNIYAPAGTKAVYIEPISQYGTERYESSGFGMDWNGVNTPPQFGTEVETLFQQGTTMRITKVEKRYNGFFVDMEVIDQSVQQRWKP